MNELFRGLYQTHLMCHIGHIQVQCFDQAGCKLAVFRGPAGFYRFPRHWPHQFLGAPPHVGGRQEAQDHGGVYTGKHTLSDSQFTV